MELFRRCFWTSLLIALPICAIVWWITESTQQSIPVNSRFEEPTSGLVLLTFLLTVAMVTSVQCLRWFVVSRQNRSTTLTPTLE